MSPSIHDFHDDPRNADIRIWINGQLKPRAEATVSVFDSGFVLGDGVWEGLRVSEGQPGRCRANGMPRTTPARIARGVLHARAMRRTAQRRNDAAATRHERALGPARPTRARGAYRGPGQGWQG